MASETPSLDKLVGCTIGGRYLIARVLGQGGMGAVYQAEHTGTGRRVAVKVIQPDQASKVDVVKRFQREARAAGSIETPHIVQVLDTGTDEATGFVYMVMELLHGEDMKQLIGRLGKVPPSVALRLIAQSCVGLAKAHGAGVVHRDIKPANLFLSIADGGAVTVKVVDFGIAKVEPGRGEDATLTRTGGMLGSPLYMSPEQAVGRKTIDHRTDVWSLGVVLYQALTGHVPHQADTLGGLILAICSEPIPPIQDAAPWIGPEIAELVHRSLRQDPDERFADMAEMAQAIARVLPGPITVDASELVPVGEAEQADVAPRSVAVGAATAMRSITSIVPPAGMGAAGAQTGALSALAVSSGDGSARRRRSSLVVAVLSLALLGGGAAAYVRTRRPAASVPVAPASTPASTVVATAETAASAVAVTGAPTSTAPAPVVAPAAPAEQVVRVAIDPADATVEVDGRPVPVSDGSVEIRGALGSMHHLRVAKGRRDSSAEVVIAAQGAVPPRVRVEGADAKAAGTATAATSRPAGKAPGTAAAAATGAPEAPPADAPGVCTPAAKSAITGKIVGTVTNDASVVPGDYPFAVGGGTATVAGKSIAVGHPECSFAGGITKHGLESPP